MYWYAVFSVRRVRPRDEHTRELIDYLDREFRATWKSKPD
jgi:hypothetical protein